MLKYAVPVYAGTERWRVERRIDGPLHYIHTKKDMFIPKNKRVCVWNAVGRSLHGGTWKTGRPMNDTIGRRGVGRNRRKNRERVKQQRRTGKEGVPSKCWERIKATC